MDARHNVPFASVFDTGRLLKNSKISVQGLKGCGLQLRPGLQAAPLIAGLVGSLRRSKLHLYRGKL